MNGTIRVTTRAGADVEISQGRPEMRPLSSGDFHAHTIAETLDAVVARVRASYGITSDPATVAADTTDKEQA